MANGVLSNCNNHTRRKEKADRCLGKQELDFLLQELADIIDPDSSYNLIVCGSGALSLCYGINFGKTDDLGAFDVNLIDYPDELSENVLEISRRHPELHLKAHWLNDDIMRFASYSNEFGADDMRYVLNSDRTIQYQGRDEYGYATGGMITDDLFLRFSCFLEFSSLVFLS